MNKTNIQPPPTVGHVQDELNPKFIFNMTATDLLVQAMTGKINLEELAARELSNRGLNHHGVWVGFDRAKEVMNEYLENS